MGIQKNFVVKNGLEVKSNLILANSTSNTVGIGTSVTRYTLHVNGGIGATSLQIEGGIGTIPQLRSTNAVITNVASSGIVTAGSININSTEIVSSGRELKNIASLDATTTATIETAIANVPNDYPTLRVTGVSTFTNGPVLVGGGLSTGTANQVLQVVGVNSGAYIGGNLGIGSINPTTKLWVEGVVTATDLNVLDEITSPILNATTIGSNQLNSSAGIVTNLTGSNLNYTGIGSIRNFRSLSGIVTNFSSGIGSITQLRVLSGIVTNLTGTAATYTTGNFGTVFGGTAYINTGIATNLSGTRISYSGISTISGVVISSGIITATASGIVTYYGDGRQLLGYGIGINTVTGNLGYGVTTLDFRGPGISTITVSAGIATINISGGNVSIAVTNVAPVDPNEGNLWFNTDLGRTFIYYADSDGGEQWVDAAPFNIGIISPVSIGLSSGTLQSPSLYFTSDSDTGLYSPSLGSVALVADATQPLTVSNSRVGIGSTLPSSSFALDVRGGTRFTGNVNVSGVTTITNSAGTIRVGVGTTALIVEGNARITGVTTITNSAGTIRVGVGTTALIVEGNARITGILTVGTGSITINGTKDTISGITTAYITSLNEGSFSGFRNKIINGYMLFDQRASSPGAESIYGAGTGYVLDRWQGATTIANNLGIARSTSAPPGFAYSLRARAVTGATIGISSYFTVLQSIEAHNVTDLSFGTSSAKTVTLSFWVRSSVTGTHSGSLRNADNNRSYPFTYTISSANTWEYESITIPGDTTGTWNLNNNLIGIQLLFDLGTGSNFRGTAGSWAAANYAGATGAVSPMATAGATWNITGVQLESGPVATPFELRNVTNELTLCQRYYVKESLAYVLGYIGSGTFLGVSVTLPVAMRTAPLLIQTSTANANLTTNTLEVSNNQYVYVYAGGLVIGNATLSSIFSSDAEF